MEPSASQILAAWERGLRQSLGERALSLLALAGDSQAPACEMPAGRRDAALLRIRRQLAGDRIDAWLECRGCGERLDVTLSVTELLPGETAHAAAPIALALDGYSLEIRLPTSWELAGLRDAGDVDEGVARLLRQCVLAAEREGSPIAPEAFPPHVYRALDEALAEADPGGVTTIAAECPSCGAVSRSIFDIPSILWPEVRQLACAIMLDVHELARAYGWDESAVLALSPARRRFYLEAQQG